MPLSAFSSPPAPDVTTRYDIQATVIYIGRAARGSTTASAVWLIQRIDFDGNGNPTQSRWSSTTAVWDNRTSETYT